MSSDGLTDGEILHFVEQFYAEGGSTLFITGGEPLLRKELVQTLIQAKRDAAIYLLTNGTLIDDSFAAGLREYNVFVQVSIDGPRASIHDAIRGRGAFEAAMKGVEALKRNGMADRTNFCTTVTGRNVNELKNILQLTRDTGISYIRFIPLRSEGRACANWSDIGCDMSRAEYEHFLEYVFNEAPEDFGEMRISGGVSGFVLDPGKFDSRTDQWCSIGKMLTVDADGSVYPCVMFMDRAYRMGSIQTESIAVLKESTALLRTVDEIVRRKEKIAQCRSCLWKNFCQGGCMGLALDKYGTVWEADEFCGFRKRLYDQAAAKLVDGKKPSCVACGESE